MSRCRVCVTFLVLFAFGRGAPEVTAQALSNERFGSILVQRGPEKSNLAVVVFSGKHGFDPKAQELLRAIAGGATVIGVNSGQYQAGISHEDSDEECSYLAGEVVRLNQSAQKSAGVSHLQRAVLVGIDEGAALAYSVYAQSPEDFVGLLTVNFVPQLDLVVPLCAADAFESRRLGDRVVIHELENDTPLNWIALNTPISSDAEVVTRMQKGHFGARQMQGPSTSELIYQKIWELPKSASQAGVETIDQQGVSVVELPASNSKLDYFVFFLSGDGGWATIDREIGNRLQSNGIDVLGFDSLRYFWKRRTDEQTAGTLRQIVRTYLAKWNKKRVVFLGFSFGADVLPAALNDFPQADLDRVAYIGLLSPERQIDFEVNIGDWLGVESTDHLTDNVVEAKKLPASRMGCFYGADEADDALCPKLPGVKTHIFPGDHHFGGAYDAVTAAVLEDLRALPAMTPVPATSAP